MKKVLLTTMIPFFISSGHSPSIPVKLLDNQPSIKPTVEKQIIVVPTKPINDLVTALIYVESRGIDSAIGDRHLGEPSVGVLQIRPIMVREVNRICKKKGLKERFILKDRFDREKSIHMFMIWKEYYHKDNNFEAIARSWNGGPRWRKIKRTEHYWAKVEKQLNLNN